MKRPGLVLLFILLIACIVAAWHAYGLFGPATSNDGTVAIRIRMGWDHEKLAAHLKEKTGLKDELTFITWVKRLGYKTVKPCTIDIPPETSVYEIAEILKANRNQTVNITILGSMNLKKMAKMLASKIEIDSDSFEQLLSGGKIYETGYDDKTWPALFIPNTYNFSVATTQAGFIERMVKENVKFWTSERLELAEKKGFSTIEVATLASIVTKESNKTDEYEKIAGVYINRLRKGMLLQADPTIAFARGYDGRILKKDLGIESPYNTYIHKGLPPGPICIPNISSINAVLEYESHPFLYFVADPSLNGYHHFSKTLVEHEIWAAKFRIAAWKKEKLKN